jgi:hypothetical protein
MKVSFLKNIPAEKFVSFNKKSFPGKQVEKIIDFRYFNPLNNSTSIENNVVATDDNQNIIGQMCYHSASYFFNNELLQSEWGFDFFVDPESRNDAVGLQVLDFIKANKLLPIFGVGLGKRSLKLQKVYGFHLIGYLKKYYKIVNPIFLLSGFLTGRHVKTARYPKFVGKGENRFQKVSADELWSNQSPYNQSLLEFGRDKNFLSWRFFSSHFQYAVYRKVSDAGSPQPVYFAVRTTKVKKITCLILSDFRFDTDKKSDFKAIVNAASSVASALYLPIVVTGSSHHVSDAVLEEARFKITGEDRTIVSNVKEYKQYQDQITARNFLFTTLADTDGEYLM